MIFRNPVEIGIPRSDKNLILLIGTQARIRRIHKGQSRIRIEELKNLCMGYRKLSDDPLHLRDYHPVHYVIAPVIEFLKESRRLLQIKLFRIVPVIRSGPASQQVRQRILTHDVAFLLIHSQAWEMDVISSRDTEIIQQTCLQITQYRMYIRGRISAGYDRKASQYHLDLFFGSGLIQWFSA